MGKKLELLGRQFGRLTVNFELLERNSDGLVVWLCSCECGRSIKTTSARLKKGDVKSCGCLQKEAVKKTSEANKTHGKSKDKIYQTWRSMIRRCFDKKTRQFKDYGGRGITVCDEWLSFERFFKDMGDRPNSSMSIERIDNSMGYCKENCKWATPTQQANNRRNSKKYIYNGKEKSLSEIAREIGAPRATLYYRAKTGAPIWDGIV